MDDVSSITEAEDAAENGFKCAQIVHNFMTNRWRNSLGSVRAKGRKDEILIGLWQRGLFWMRSLSKLNQTSDFQAVATESRAMLEIYIDMALLHFDSTGNSIEKYYWWIKSEKLKAFELEIQFKEKNSLRLDIDLVNFVNENKKEVLSNRQKFWGKEKHPTHRWTDNTLELDVKEVDKLNRPETEEFLTYSLEYYYECVYRRTNWDIHSGATTFYKMPPQKFSINNFWHFWYSSNLGILCTKILLRELGFANDPNYFNEMFRQIFIKTMDFLPE